MTTIQINSYARHDQSLCLAIAHVAEHHLDSAGVLTDKAAAILLPDALAIAPEWYEFDGLTLTYMGEDGLPSKLEKWRWPAVAGYSGFTCVRLSTGAEMGRFPAEDAPAVLVLHLE